MNKPLGKTSKTAENIIECATQLFAQKGYDGTIMDTLAEQCGVNKASIYYHFSDKATLYNACMTGLFQRVVQCVLDAINPLDSPKVQLECWIRTLALTAQKHPQMPAALMRELASGGIHMPEPARREMQRLLRSLAGILAQGEAQNCFRAADALMLQFMILGGFCFHISSQPMRDAIVAETPQDPSLCQAITLVTEMVLNALDIEKTQDNKEI